VVSQLKVIPLDAKVTEVNQGHCFTCLLIYTCPD